MPPKRISQEGEPTLKPYPPVATHGLMEQGWGSVRRTGVVILIDPPRPFWLLMEGAHYLTESWAMLPNAEIKTI